MTFFPKEGPAAEYLSAWKHSTVFYAMGDFQDKFYNLLVRPRIPYSSYDTDFARLILHHEPDRKEYHRFLLDLEPSEILYLIDAANWKSIEPELPIFLRNIQENGELLPDCRVLIAVLDPNRTQKRRPMKNPFSWIPSLQLCCFSSERELLREAEKSGKSLAAAFPQRYDRRGNNKYLTTTHSFHADGQSGRYISLHFPLKKENILPLLREVILETGSRDGEYISLLQSESIYIAGMYRNIFDAPTVEKALQKERRFWGFCLYTLSLWEQMNLTERTSRTGKMEIRRKASAQDFLLAKTERIVVPDECFRLSAELSALEPIRQITGHSDRTCNAAELHRDFIRLNDMMGESGQNGESLSSVARRRPAVEKLLFILNLYYIQMMAALLHTDRLILDLFHGRPGAGFGEKVYDMTGHIRLSDDEEPRVE